MDWNQIISHKLPNMTYIIIIKREITFPVNRGWMTEQQSKQNSLSISYDIESIMYVAIRQYLIIK